jgi:hypothetical protein
MQKICSSLVEEAKVLISNPHRSMPVRKQAVLDSLLPVLLFLELDAIFNCMPEMACEGVHMIHFLLNLSGSFPP